MIYYYFGSKEGLVSAALEHALAQLIALYESLERSDSDAPASLDSWYEAHRIADGAMQKFLKITFSYSLSKDRMPQVDVMIRRMYADRNRHPHSQHPPMPGDGDGFRVSTRTKLARFISGAS